MPASRSRIRALAVAAAAFAFITVTAGGTLAASTNPPTLYACFNVSGQVAMSTIPQCKLTGGGQLAYWSTQGVPGPTGPTGATGPTGSTGPTGAQGPSGVRAWAHVKGDGTILDAVNVVHVDHAAPGVNYCVYLDPGIDIHHIAPVATAESVGTIFLAEVVVGCGTFQGRDGIQVNIVQLDTLQLQSQPGFFLVVP